MTYHALSQTYTKNIKTPNVFPSKKYYICIHNGVVNFKKTPTLFAVVFEKV